MNLYPYQDDGATWLASRKRALLADGMRVGKTPQAIAAADMVGARSILVVCPAIARPVWAKHFAEVSIMGHTIRALVDKDDELPPDGVVIVSMDASRNEEIFEKVMSRSWDVMILDECQFLKEPTSQRTKQVLSAKGFASKAARIWFLSGTPMLNHPGELWVILSTIGVYRKAYTEFLNEFCHWYTDTYGNPKIVGVSSPKALKALVDKVTLRRTYHKLFPETTTPVWADIELDMMCEGQDDQAVNDLLKLEATRKYGQRTADAIAASEADPTSDWKEHVPAANFSELRRITSQAKVIPVVRWLRAKLEANEFDKVVVFAYHGMMIEHITAALAPFGSRTVYGGTPSKKRDAAIERFRTNHKARVLVCQHQVAGTAIDLTSACHLVFAELSVVPENNAQSAMRIQGPRQTRPVTLYVCRLTGTMDDAVTKILARKTRMVEQLFDA